MRGRGFGPGRAIETVGAYAIGVVCEDYVCQRICRKYVGVV